MAGTGTPRSSCPDAREGWVEPHGNETLKQDIEGFNKLKVLGSGAYSTIFLARDRSANVLRAVKQVLIKDSEQARYIGHLEQEHEIASQFDHPVLRKTFKIIYARKFIKISGASLVMEYAEGHQLSDLMPSKDYIGMLKVFRHLTMGLEAMHAKGYVHADLKPENVILNSEGRVKLIDYGQSFRMGVAKERVQGTVDFIAPEQVRREPLDARTDVFGLGAVMHRVFTNKPLQTEMNKNLSEHTMNLIGQRVTDSNPLAETEMPKRLRKLIEHCCQRDRADRPPNMQVVRNMIEHIMVRIHRKITKQDGRGTTPPGDPDLPTAQAG